MVAPHGVTSRTIVGACIARPKTNAVVDGDAKRTTNGRPYGLHNRHFLGTFSSVILTLNNIYGIINTVSRYPESTIHGGGCFPLHQGSIILFLPYITRGEVIAMYVTLTELLMILTLLITFAKFLLEFFNDEK